MSFDPNLSTAKDRARLRLGDTANTAADPELLADATIEATIDRFGEKEGTAILAESLGALFYRRAETYEEADVKKIWRDRAKGMFDLAKAIRTGPNIDEPYNLDDSLGPSSAGKLADPDLSEYRTD